MMLRTLFMCGVGTLVSQFRCKDKLTDYSFCFPILPAAEGLIFASLVAFLLGLFISTTFTRWWTIREKIGVISNNTAALTLLLKNFTAPEEPIKAISKTILRWMHLAHALVYKQANNDFTFDDLTSTNLITDEESERLSKSIKQSLPALIYGWCIEHLRSLLKENKVAPVAAQNACLACVTNAFNASQDLAIILNTQMPYAYLHLLTYTAKIHLAFIVFYGGGMIAQGISGYAWTRIVLGYTVIITNNIIYEGLLNIHAVLVNPLGDDVGDYPTNLFVSSALNLCNEGLQIEPPPEEAEDYRHDDDDEGTITIVV